jgi:hypothetical protein
MQTEKWSIQDVKNKLGAVVAAAKTVRHRYTPDSQICEK